MYYKVLVLSLFLRNRDLWRPASVFCMWCDVILFRWLYLGQFSRHYHFWSERDCRWPWELLHLWQTNLNYKPHALSRTRFTALSRSLSARTCYPSSNFVMTDGKTRSPNSSRPCTNWLPTRFTVRRWKTCASAPTFVWLPILWNLYAAFRKRPTSARRSSTPIWRWWKTFAQRRSSWSRSPSAVPYWNLRSSLCTSFITIACRAADVRRSSASLFHRHRQLRLSRWERWPRRWIGRDRGSMVGYF